MELQDSTAEFNCAHRATEEREMDRAAMLRWIEGHPGSVHGEEEIEAVVSVLRGGATALRIGKRSDQ